MPPPCSPPRSSISAPTASPRRRRSSSLRGSQVCSEAGCRRVGDRTALIWYSVFDHRIGHCFCRHSRESGNPVYGPGSPLARGRRRGRMRLIRERAMAEIDGGTLDRLYAVIASRRGGDPATSYTAKLFAAGPVKIAQKLGEEAVETVSEGARGNAAGVGPRNPGPVSYLPLLLGDTRTPRPPSCPALTN